MRHPTKLLRLQANFRWFFQWAIRSMIVVASAWSVVELGFAESQALSVGEVGTAGADKHIGPKLPAKKVKGRSSQTVPDGFSPETLPGYLQGKYSEISWLVTHNAMSNRAEGWWFPNQSFGITRQLNDGVRGLMLDVHMIDNQLFLLHGSSMLGTIPLKTILAEINAFMRKRPNAVISLILECYAPATKVQEAFKTSGLLGMLHQQDSGSSWPTIGEMITSNKRLVLFTDSGGGEWQGYHDVWKFCQETHYSVKQVDEFSFKRNRGEESNSLLILNHFLTRPIAGLGLAKRANAVSVLEPRLEGCEKAMKRFPNFVAVDFYECGDTPKLLYEFNRQQAEKQRIKKIQAEE